MPTVLVICQYWLVLYASKQPRVSLLPRVIVYCVLLMISLSPVALATVSKASAGEKPTTPLIISQVRSSNVVYVLATSGCAQPSCLRLLRTTVDAESFTSVADRKSTRLNSSHLGISY